MACCSSEPCWCSFYQDLQNTVTGLHGLVAPLKQTATPANMDCPSLHLSGLPCWGGSTLRSQHSLPEQLLTLHQAGPAQNPVQSERDQAC